ncbi:hypothetical protein ACF07B_36180 [Streptomyces sp. NPDC015532]|uniref:hypothetical protein n=1 Tax=Streptomyces sp. NPDC015532 TaxID=3364960 RepID=UPI0036FFFA5A
MAWSQVSPVAPGSLAPTLPAADPTVRRGRIGRREVQELEATARAFRAWDHKYGGGLRRKAVVGQLNEVAGHLDEHQTPPVEQALFRVMAQLGGVAATMAWDSGLHKQDQNYYLLALRAAHAGGDAWLRRQPAGRNGPANAVHRQATGRSRTHPPGTEGCARASASPRVRAMLHTREAWAYAAMGRAAAFERATQEAAEVLAESSGAEEPYWIAYFNEAELAGVTGGRLLDMARHNPHEHAEAAATSIRNALTTRGAEAGLSHALDLIGLAECHFLVGDVTGAVEQTHRAVDAAADTRSGRVRMQLSQLYPYTVGRSTSSTVGEARARLREVLSI